MNICAVFVCFIASLASSYSFSVSINPSALRPRRGSISSVASGTRRASLLFAKDVPLDCLVIGSGVTGSCLSFHLSQKDRNVLMFDRNDKVGGNVISLEKDGFVWEVSWLVYVCVLFRRRCIVAA